MTTSWVSPDPLHNGANIFYSEITALYTDGLGNLVYFEDTDHASSSRRCRRRSVGSSSSERHATRHYEAVVGPVVGSIRRTTEATIPEHLRASCPRCGLVSMLPEPEPPRACCSMATERMLRLLRCRKPPPERDMQCGFCQHRWNPRAEVGDESYNVRATAAFIRVTSRPVYPEWDSSRDLPVAASLTLLSRTDVRVPAS